MERRAKNELVAANGHMVQKNNLQESKLCTGTFKTKRLHSVKIEFSLYWMSQCIACSPARCFLYHVTISCKGFIGRNSVFSFISLA